MQKLYPELSTPELRVAAWLTRRDITFIPQMNLFGGTAERGGARVDFILPMHQVVIRVQSYWHLEPETEARDVLQAVRIIAEGFRVVDVWEDDLEENIDYVMSEALEGRSIRNA